MQSNTISETIQKSGLLVCYFSTPDCQVCKILLPQIQKLVENYHGLNFLYISVQKHPDISGQNLVFTVPTIIIFQNGKEQKRFSRHFSISEFEQALDRILN